MQIIADNDFALFVGTSNSITRLIYQNNVSWSGQLSALTSFSFSLQGAETTFYLLGMGAGGQENVSGTLNGVDITTIPVLMSSNVVPYLTGYAAALSNSNLDNGTYNASLTDVQTALPQVTFGSPTVSTTDTVITQSPTKRGYTFPDSTAHLFQFAAAATNVTATPEPSTFLLLLGGGVVMGLSRFRGRASANRVL